MTIDSLKQVLEGWSGSGPWKARCPAHNDGSASLSIIETEDGRPYLTCHAGCSYNQVKSALSQLGVGMVEKEVRYEYKDSSGEAAFTKVRKPGKKFFIEGKVKPILYGLPEVLKGTDRVVFIVEGEKDVETLRELGLLATCGYEGSSKWREEYSDTLEGRTVVILPDHDEPGAKYGQKIASSLLNRGCKVKLIGMPVFYARLGRTAPDKSDISDFVRDGGTVEIIREIASDAPFLSALAGPSTPSSEDLTERCVISSLFTIPEAREEVLGSLKSFELQSFHCRQILATVEKLAQAGYSVDMATVSSQLPAELSSYLSVLLQEVQPVASVASHISLIKQAYARRTLIFQCGELSQLAQDPTVDVEELLDSAESRIMGLRSNSSPDEIPDISKGVIQALKTIEDRIDRGEGLSGVPTGLTDLDSYTDGLQPSDLILLAARPGMGKTALAMNIVEHVALQQGKKVLVFSLEMSTTQLVTRMLSSISSLDSQKIKRGDLSPSQVQKLTLEAERLAKSKLVIDDTSSLSISKLRSRARREHKKGVLSLIVIDYLQLMRGSANSERRERELAEISAGLKSLAKELNVPVLALSQLNRALEGRTDKRPNNSDLRESGALEQDADIILFVYRECVYNEEASPRIAELIVSKHRNGPLGSILLQFNGPTTKFSDLDIEEPSKPEPVREPEHDRHSDLI